MLFNIQKINFLVSSDEKDFSAEVNEIKQRLFNGEFKIYFSFNKANSTISYYAISKEENIAIGVYKTSTLFLGGPSNIISYPSPGQIALLQYIDELESNSSEEDLEKFYGYLYDEISFLNSMTPKELEKFNSEKNQLTYLEASLVDEPIIPVSKVTPSLGIKISRDLSDFYITLDLNLPQKIAITNITKFLNELEDGRVKDKKGNSYDINFHSFSIEDQNIILLLMRLKQFSYYSTKYKASLSDVIEIGKNKINQHITFEGDLYFVNKPIEAKVEINSDGNLYSNLDKKWLIWSDVGIKLNSTTKTVELASIKNQKLRTLIKFIQDNPDFNYKRHIETFANLILPKILDTAEISDEYVKRANTYRTAIQLYLDITEEGLECKTIYIKKGKEVGSAEFFDADEEKLTNYQAVIRDKNIPENGIVEDGEEIVEIIRGDFTQLRKYSDVYLSDSIVNFKESHHRKIDILTASGINWFSIEVASKKYTSEELQAILSGYKRKKKYVRLKDAIITLDDEEMIDTVANFDIDEATLTSAKLPLYQALKLKYLENSSSLQATQEITNLFRAIANFNKRSIDLDEKYLSVLRPYQLDGVRWLKTLDENHLGGILGDDMGLGKSLQLISFLSTVTLEKPGLIVSPKSLIFNWQNEFIKWKGKQTCVVVTGLLPARKELLALNKNKKDVIFITSYDSLRNDQEIYQDIDFSYVILDEAQFIANALAKKTLAVKSIKSETRFVLTGTPIQNSLVDLWSIFDFLLPGYLDAYKEFKNTFKKLELDDSYSISRLEKLVAPFILRRNKIDVLKELPAKQEEIITIKMNEAQQTFYDAMYNEAKIYLKNNSKNSGGNKIKLLAYLTKLREICVDPTLLVDNFVGESDKLEYVINLISDSITNGHKVLIFSSFATVLKHLEKTLEEQQISNGFIYGQTSAKDRIDLANKFNDLDSSLKVMLVSLKAGGTGLNLIGADIVVHLDPWWNLAAENQATDRAHRIGQNRAVTVYKLICKSTIEEKVIILQNKKKQLGEIIHDYDEDNPIFSDDDIKFLLN